jgi:choline kinase
MKAVIIAAGIGSRIINETDNVPKTLLPYSDGTILSTILKNIYQAGIHDFVVVVGYQSGYIKNYLEKNNYFGYDITIIENPQWIKGNGISVLITESEVVEEDFLLSMSDHIVSLSALKRVVNCKSDKNFLLVDPQTEKIFDIDDATKVFFKGNRIVDIGKDISQFNGIDCGIFRLNNRFFKAMREALMMNRDSISSAIEILIKNMDMEAVYLEQNESWIDIDTYQAYQYCLNNIKF